MTKGILHLDPARALGCVLQAELRISARCHLTDRVEDLDETVEGTREKKEEAFRQVLAGGRTFYVCDVYALLAARRESAATLRHLAFGQKTQ